MGRNSWGFTVVTPAAGQVVSTSEIKSQLAIAQSVRDHDSHVNRLVRSAVQQIEGLCGLRMLTTVLDFRIDRFPRAGCPIRLPLYPVTSVESLKYIDTSNVEQTWSTSNYETLTHLTPTELRTITGSWPATHSMRSAVTVRASVGYGSEADIPEDLQTAVLMLAAERFLDRSGETDRLPPAVKAIVDQYMIGDELLFYAPE